MKHSFYASLPAIVGVVPAVLLTQIEYWVSKNRENKKNFKEGKYWTYNSAEKMAEYFPYLNARQIKYALQRLKSEDLIIIDNFNKNKLDRTAWYTLTDKAYSIIQNRTIESTTLYNKKNNFVQSQNNKVIQTNNPNQKEKNKQKRKDAIVYGGER